MSRRPSWLTSTGIRSTVNVMVNHSITDLNATFSALSDPIRRGILEHLARGEATAGELAKPYAVTLPAISRHLRVLEQAGLLARRKTGRVHHCRLNPKPMRHAAVWIEQYRRFWEQRFDALETYLDSMPDEETTQWQQPNPKPTPQIRSKSDAPSKRRVTKSSGRGPNGRHEALVRAQRPSTRRKRKLIFGSAAAIGSR